MSSIQEVDNSKMREKSGLYSVPMQVAEPLLLRGDCVELLEKIPSDSIDAIITDPPYLYLNPKEKNSAFDKPFDERKVFLEYKRILKPTGFLLFFGRGQAFYRWNTMVGELGFVFKEEIVWNKVKPSSPFLPILRRHELCAIYGKSKIAHIRKRRIPYTEALEDKSIQRALERLIDDIGHIKANMNNIEFLEDVKTWLESGKITNRRISYANCSASRMSTEKMATRELQTFYTMKEGSKETDVISIPDWIDATNPRNLGHPTQKPTRLMERLIAIVTDEGDVVLDSFMGSGTTGVACLNTGRRFIGMELAEEYFEIAKGRVEKALKEYKKKEEEVKYDLFKEKINTCRSL